jgi:hypothetical protein
LFGLIVNIFILEKNKNKRQIFEIIFVLSFVTFALLGWARARD